MCFRQHFRFFMGRYYLRPNDPRGRLKLSSTGGCGSERSSAQVTSMSLAAHGSGCWYALALLRGGIWGQEKHFSRSLCRISVRRQSTFARPSIARHPVLFFVAAHRAVPKPSSLVPHCLPTPGAALHSTTVAPKRCDCDSCIFRRSGLGWVGVDKDRFSCCRNC